MLDVIDRLGVALGDVDFARLDPILKDLLPRLRIKLSFCRERLSQCDKDGEAGNKSIPLHAFSEAQAASHRLVVIGAPDPMPALPLLLTFRPRAMVWLWLLVPLPPTGPEPALTLVLTFRPHVSV